MTPDFVPFPKIARLSREIVITEKIDGTNAVIHVPEEGELVAGSRTQWLTSSDNFGFAAWVKENAEELRTLGPGTHYGEWWGMGIQRNYGLKHKKFSLFNTNRWIDSRPTCCGVVPVLYTGPFDTTAIEWELTLLRTQGSIVAPGFMKPEGVVVYHPQSRAMFKKTIEKDEEHKGGLD